MTGLAEDVGLTWTRSGGRSIPDDIEPFFAEWARAREIGKEFRAYHRLRMADGAYHWMHAVGRPAIFGERYDTRLVTAGRRTWTPSSALRRRFAR